MTPALYALALYSGLLGLIGMWLMANVGSKRGKAKVSVGDGGDAALIRAMRGQANFIENVPLALILLFIAALLNMPVWLIHLLGSLLVAGRFFHALHFTRDDAPGWQRSVGAILSILVITLLSLVLVAHAIKNLI